MIDGSFNEFEFTLPHKHDGAQLRARQALARLGCLVAEMKDLGLLYQPLKVEIQHHWGKAFEMVAS